MVESIRYNLFYTFMIQFLISISIVLLANPIFDFFGINYVIRDIFKITTVGALFNISFFIIILVLLYFEKRRSALLIAFSFFTSNTLLTLYFAAKGLKYTGYGFTVSSILTFIIALIMLSLYLNNINYETFALQPLYVQEPKDIFVKLANYLNNRVDKKQLKKSKQNKLNVEKNKLKI